MRRKHHSRATVQIETHFAPGLILFCTFGLGPLAAAQLAWCRHQPAPIAALGAGVALLIWMSVEIAIVGYTNSRPLQPFYLLLGAVITGIGLGWRISLGRAAPRSGQSTPHRRRTDSQHIAGWISGLEVEKVWPCFR